MQGGHASGDGQSGVGHAAHHIKLHILDTVPHCLYSSTSSSGARTNQSSRQHVSKRYGSCKAGLLAAVLLSLLG